MNTLTTHLHTIELRSDTQYIVLRTDNSHTQLSNAADAQNYSDMIDESCNIVDEILVDRHGYRLDADLCRISERLNEIN